MNVIKPQPLTKLLFAPFGDVIEIDGAQQLSINNGTTTRYHDLAGVDIQGENARSLISIFRGQGFNLPLEIKMMERHPLGSQAFVGLSQREFLVIVAHDEGGQPATPLAFIAAANQGVNYYANVWHHPLVALKKEADFLIVDRGGDGNNLEEYIFENPFLIKKD